MSFSNRLDQDTNVGHWDISQYFNYRNKIRQVKQVKPSAITNLLLPPSPLQIFGSDLVAWYDLSDASTIMQSGGFINSIADKSGSGVSPLLQATSVNQPAYQPTGWGLNFPGLFLDGVNDFMEATGLPVGGTSLTAIIGADQHYAGVNNDRLLAFQGIGQAVEYDNTASALLVITNATPSPVGYRNGSFLSTYTVPSNLYSQMVTVARASRFTSVYDGINHTLYVNRFAAPSAVSTGTFGTTGTLRLGAFIGGTNPWQGAVGEIIIVKRAPTVDELNNSDAWLLRHWPRILVTAGDSIVWSGLLNNPGYSKLYLPNANIGKQSFLEDMAIPGSAFNANGPTSQDYVAVVGNINSCIPVNKYGKQYVLYFSYSNHLGTISGINDATIYTNALGAAATNAKLAGFDKVVTSTILSRTDPGMTNDTMRHAVNSILMTPGWAVAHGFDAVSDFAADPIMGVDAAPTVNPTYFEDAVHPNAAGNVRLEVIFRATMNVL